MKTKLVNQNEKPEAKTGPKRKGGMLADMADIDVGNMVLGYRHQGGMSAIFRTKISHFLIGFSPQPSQHHVKTSGRNR